jgi:hypothetical protein
MIFIQNKYTKIYYSIISRAQSRDLPKETYTEKHHIIPKSLGGGNSKDNLAVLTAREHFICHMLLVRMTTGNYRHKMINAAIGMKRNKNGARYINSRLYDITKLEYAKVMSERRKGSKASLELRARLSAIHTGQGNGMYGKKQSEITKQKIREARALQDNSHLAGRIITPEWRQKISDTLKNGSSTKGKAKPVHQCIHCGGIYS